MSDANRPKSSAAQTLAAIDPLCLEMKELSTPCVQLRDGVAGFLSALVSHAAIGALLEGVLRDFLALLVSHRCRSRFSRRLHQSEVVRELGALSARMDSILCQLPETGASWTRPKPAWNPQLDTSTDHNITLACIELARIGTPTQKSQAVAALHRLLPMEGNADNSEILRHPEMRMPRRFANELEKHRDTVFDPRENLVFEQVKTGTVYEHGDIIRDENVHLERESRSFDAKEATFQPCVVTAEQRQTGRSSPIARTHRRFVGENHFHAFDRASKDTLAHRKILFARVPSHQRRPVGLPTDQILPNPFERASNDTLARRRIVQTIKQK